MNMSRSSFSSLFSVTHHRLTAAEFSSENSDHLAQLHRMGIRLQVLSNGRKYIEFSIRSRR